MNTDDDYIEDDFTTPSKKITKVRQVLSRSLKIIFNKK